MTGNRRFPVECGQAKFIQRIKWLHRFFEDFARFPADPLAALIGLNDTCYSDRKASIGDISEALSAG